MENNNKFYVYEYIRTDSMEPFYVGKGSGNRYLDLNKRNDYFKMIIDKMKVLVNILEDDLTEEEAFDIECWYINEYKYIYGYNLCNVTDG
jgi:hypothetical protein